MAKQKERISRPGRRLILGFLLIILIGGTALATPFTHNPGIRISWLDALFVSTSAVCVTGLVPVDIAATFNLAGRTVIAILIQLGGLGFASIAIFFLVLFGKTIGASQRSLIKEALNAETGRGMIGLVKTVAIGATVIELIGAAALYTVFSKDYEPLSAIGMSLFHAISAFNNAGFDLLGNFTSLTGYNTDIVLNCTISALIALGGLGFFVYRDVLTKHRWKKFTMHTKIVLSTTASLIAAGMVLFMLTSGLTPLEALFQSVSARTAGFNTVDMTALGTAGLLVMIILMFIGASPGSTGGGIKTTTLFTLLVMMCSVSTRRQPTAFQRRITMESITKALVVTTMAFSVVIIGTLGLCLIEGEGFPLSYLLFESVSAFATVGLSCGVTPDLQSGSKLLLMLMMFIGRLGPLTIASSVRFREQQLSYIEEKILIG